VGCAMSICIRGWIWCHYYSGRSIDRTRRFCPWLCAQCMGA
jgi:hypothetical protein